jgi:hypothetical protein
VTAFAVLEIGNLPAFIADFNHDQDINPNGLLLKKGKG